jgi:hypothetical protein
MAIIQVKARLLQDYPGPLWPHGNKGDTSDWINIDDFKRMLLETGHGFQLIDWSFVELGGLDDDAEPAILQIVDRRRV